MKNCFTYTHTRDDNGEVFYVGAGKYHPSSKYNRANCRNSGRSKEWNKVFEETTYTVKIVLDGVTKEEACLKEIELISFYGRKCYEGGTLVNKSTGGRCSSKGYKHTTEAKDAIGKAFRGNVLPQETKEKLSIANRGKKRTDEVRRKLSEISMGKRTRGSNGKAKIVLNTITGERFNCVKDAADSIGMKYLTLYPKMVGKWKRNNTPFVYI